jgi:uncharacterized protein (DUF934 family)
MALLKNGKLVDDIYTDVSQDSTVPVIGPVIVSLAQWQAHRASLEGHKEPLGIVLSSDEKAEAIAADLQHFALIALDFPRFRDGRAYTTARLLRERYGYTGELRAVGDVLLEQLHFMHRVGFDSFDIKSSDAVRDWEIATADMSVWYQQTSDGRHSVLELRQQGRKKTAAG